MTADKKITIRKYRKSDREIVRRLCCDTGFLGNPIDPVFEDRNLFADFLTGFYTDWEPESAFVLEVKGEVKGYLLGSRRPHLQQIYNIYQNAGLFLRGIFHYPGYNQASRRFIHWIAFQGWREVPAAPRRTAHFHINLLPEARSVAYTRVLMDAYLKYLHQQGEKRVYGQMVTFESRRGAKMFERYGFRVINRSEITKYKKLHPEPVFLCTVMKNLEENAGLYERQSPVAK
jgi:ribosomal protein S18 acetylase RimI-like enzyme